MYAETESRTSDGRIDALFKTPERIVFFEFKLHGTAKEAMEQITSKDYDLAYENDGRKIVRVGVAFDQETRSLGEWLVH